MRRPMDWDKLRREKKTKKIAETEAERAAHEAVERKITILEQMEQRFRVMELDPAPLEGEPRIFRIVHTEDSTKRPPIAPEQHDWAFDSVYFGRGICRKCGVTRLRDGGNRPCRGSIGPARV